MTSHDSRLLPHDHGGRAGRVAFLVLCHEVLEDLILQLAIFHRQIFIAARKQTLSRDVRAEAIVRARVIISLTVSHRSNRVKAPPRGLLVTESKSHKLIVLLMFVVIDVTAAVLRRGALITRVDRGRLTFSHCGRGGCETRFLRFCSSCLPCYIFTHNVVL